MPTPEEKQRRLWVLLWLIVLSAAFILSLFKIESYDVWWHLKTGEYITGNKTVPRTDLFSSTASGRKWVNPSWLADVVLYGVCRRWGAAGLVVFKAAIITASMLLILLCMDLRGVPAAVGCAASVLALAAARTRLLARPEMFTFLFAALFMYLIERHRRRGSKWIFAAPVVMIPWANLHAGFAAGLILLAAYAAAERSRRIVVIWLLSLAATLVNPFFYEVLLYPVRLLGAGFVKEIHEWMPPPLSVSFLPFWIMAAVLCICALLSARETSLTDGIWMAAFLLLAVWSRRNTAVFAFVCAPILAERFCAAWGKYSRRPALQSRPAAAVAAAASVLVVCLLVSRGARAAGVGVREDIYPRKAMDFVLAQKISGNVFNEYEWGGYIIWRAFPGCRVFIDGRCLVYGDELYNLWWRIYYCGKGWDDELRKRDVRVLILNYNRPSRKQATEALGTSEVEPFYENENWKVIFWDEISMVCVRDEPENRELIERFSCGASNPGAIWKVLTTGKGLDKAMAGIERKISEDPTCYVAYDNLGQCLMVKGELDRAVEQIGKCIELNPKYGQAYYHLGVCYYRMKDYDRAVAAYKKAISRSPDYAPYHLNLGDSYLKSHRLAQAAREYRKAVKLDQSMWLARKNLAVCYERMGRYEDAIEQLKAANLILGGNESITLKIKELERRKLSR